MKRRLETPAVVSSSVSSRPSEGLKRREFLKLGGLFAAALGVGGVSMLVPRKANGQAVEIGGITVYTERISATIASLNRSSARYRRSEVTTADGSWVSGAQVRDENVQMTIGIRPNGGNNSFGVGFPAENDQRPESDRAEAGVWAAGINGFISAVETLSGDTVTRALILVDITEDADRGDTIISFYAIPQNAAGEILGQTNGGYLAVGASYYPQRGTVYGASLLLLEPGTSEPIASR